MTLLRHGGQIGEACDAFGSQHTQRNHSTGLDVLLVDFGQEADGDMHLPGGGIEQHGACPFVRHDAQLQPGAACQQFTHEVLAAAMP